LRGESASGIERDCDEASVEDRANRLVAACSWVQVNCCTVNDILGVDDGVNIQGVQTGSIGCDARKLRGEAANKGALGCGTEETEVLRIF